MQVDILLGSCQRLEMTKTKNKNKQKVTFTTTKRWPASVITNNDRVGKKGNYKREILQNYIILPL